MRLTAAEKDLRRQIREDARAVNAKTVPCETCGRPTFMLGTKRCDRCWEFEKRLKDYLDTGRKAVTFVSNVLSDYVYEIN